MDKRAEFERLTREQAPVDRDERAFIRRRIELVQGDPSLTPEEREHVLSDLRRLLGDAGDPDIEHQ